MIRRSYLMCTLIVALGFPSAAAASNCNGTQTGLVPLTGLGAATYQGYPGGLYPGGTNMRPAAHDAAGVAIANAIAPIDTLGNADPSGKVVLISIGMSNTTQEFSTFVPMANTDPQRNPKVLVIDCALGGQTASLIKNPAYAYWDTVRARLRGRRSSPLQVQVVWLKEANANPNTGFPAATTTLMRDLGSVVRTLKVLFPNVRIAYLSSRIYAGYATSSLNPEPYAYESAFAVKWLIQAQIDQVRAGRIISTRAGNLDSPEAVPWIAWGPYMWADGMTARSDGLTWARADFQSDGTHPSQSGQRKVGTMLLDFFKQEPTAKGWFLEAGTVRRRAVR